MYKGAVFAFISINCIIEPNKSMQGCDLNALWELRYGTQPVIQSL